MIELKFLKKGEFFTLKGLDFPKENQVYIKGDYDSSTKAYCCIRFDDISISKQIKGNTKAKENAL